MGLKAYAKSSYGVDMTDEEAAEAHREFFRLYKFVKIYHKRLIKQAEKEGGVWVNWCGKPVKFRPAPGISSSDQKARGSAQRIVFNTPIQGGANIYTARPLIMMHQEKLKGNLWKYGILDLIGTVHDSIWSVVVMEEVERAFRYQGYLMTTQPTVRDVPLEIESKLGDSLGTMETVGEINSLDDPKKPKGLRRYAQV